MCLIPTHRFPKIAKESIVVLKLVKKDKFEKETYWPPYVYTNFKYELGKRQKAHSRLWISWIILRNMFSKGIESGFIHSARYPKEKDFPYDGGTEGVINTCWSWGKSYALLKCVIPKGSFYYVNDTIREYASREIIPIKDVTSEILCQRVVM